MKRPNLCADMDHPGVTYNPWLGKTWCLCGGRIYPGDTTDGRHLACCDGPLVGTGGDPDDRAPLPGQETLL